MQDCGKDWVGAYYPMDLPQDQWSKSILCLLFDKLVCHFPIAHTGCGGGLGCSHELVQDARYCELYDAGIIELREELFSDKIDADFSSGYAWGTDAEFDDFYCGQVTALALDACAEFGFVPITDNPNWPVPYALLNSREPARMAKVQASALAVRSLEIIVPRFSSLSNEEILEARERLSEHLVPFRRSMLSLAPTLRAGITSDSPLSEILREAEYVVQTRVAPLVAEMKERIEKENGRFWRRLIMKGGSAVPKFALNWATRGSVAAAVDSLATLKEIATDAIDQERLTQSMLISGGVGYLLAAGEYVNSSSGP